MQRLEVLNTYLQHFDESPDFGDGEAVAEIRRLLLCRIREVESAMRCRECLQQSRTEAA